MNENAKTIIKRVHTGLLILWAFTMAFPTGIVNTMMGMVLFIFIVRCIFVRDVSLRYTHFLLFFLLFFLFSAVSMFNSISFGSSVHGLTKVLTRMLIFFVVLHSIEDKNKLKKVIIALLLGGVFACVDGFWQFFTGRDFLGGNPIVMSFNLRRISASFGGTNDFGIYLVTLAPLAWVLSLYHLASKHKVVGISIACLLTVSLLLTFGRGSFLGLLIAALIFILVKKDRLLIVIFCASLLTLPFVMPGSIKEWCGKAKTPLVILANEDRLIMYGTALAMFKAHPVIGVGVNTFVDNYPQYKIPEVGFTTPDKSYAHNSFLQMMAEIGTLGFLSFVCLIVVFLYGCRTIYRKSRDSFIKDTTLGLCCGVIGFLVNGLTESNLYYSRLAILFWFMIGLTLSNQFLMQREREYH